MRISVVSIPVMDQSKALAFYTEKLGFIKKHDMPVSEDARWLTVVPPEAQDGPEVLLEPAPRHFEPSKVFQEKLYEAGIPWTGFEVDDVDKEFERLKAKGVEFKVEPTDVGTARIAVFDDTCKNYIQLMQIL